MQKVRRTSHETVGTHDDEAASSRPKRTCQHETVVAVMLLRVYHEFLLWGSVQRLRDVCLTSMRESIPSYATSLTPLMILIRLGLYHAEEINEEGFEVYFQGGSRSEENFNARDYWLSISIKENLHLSRSLALTIRSLVLRVLQKMITYEVCQRTTGGGELKAKESMICCGQFITKIAKRIGLLTHEVFNTLSALTYSKALDATTLREIDSNGRFTNTPVDEIEIDDSSRYPPGEFLHEDDLSRQYQANSNMSYYITPYNCSLTNDTHVPEVITTNDQNTTHTKDVKGPPDQVNIEETLEQAVQNEQINNQLTEESLGNNTRTSVPITEPLVPKVTQS
nr:retrovirus-related Pol polyprotein from transposon TNT 1-94 [Tanacetum cinerariifolium]